MGGRAHHDLRRSQGAAAAPHLPVGTVGPWRPWNSHGFKLDALWAHACLVQHVTGLWRNGRDSCRRLTLGTRVWVFTELDFFPESDEEYEEQNDDEGQDPDANDLSWSYVGQRLGLKERREKGCALSAN